MLKPALARGELRAIGATTLNEYRKYIEKDAALERRFQIVYVGEPNVEDTIAILRGLKERYESHHKRAHQGLGHRRRGHAFASLHHATVSCPTRRSTWSTKPRLRWRNQIGSHADRDRPTQRHATNLEIERPGIEERERCELEASGWPVVRTELAEIREKTKRLRARWQRRTREPSPRSRELKEAHRAAASFEAEERRGKGNLRARRASCNTARFPRRSRACAS